VADVLPNRLAVAEKLGGIPINSREKDVVEEVMKLTGGKGAQVVLDCAGFSKTVVDSMRAAAIAGKIVVVGLGESDLNGLPFNLVSVKELVITSIFRYRNIYPIAINAVAAGSIDISGIISNRFTFDQTPEAYKIVSERASEVVKGVIVFE
jgi:L-iditol 2-dehydrogenase